MTPTQLNFIKAKEKVPSSVTLIAVSKTKPNNQILEAYQLGQRIFGENKAIEVRDKQAALPKDIQWHFIGHLQTNKIKYIAPFISLIHSIDSFKLLKEVNKEAKKQERIIPCLLQFYIAQEESKFGFDMEEVEQMLTSAAFKELANIEIHGVMGMATYTDDTAQIENEFRHLSSLFNRLKTDYFNEGSKFKEISMGMTDDFELAIKNGSTMVRIGSAIFGGRIYNK